MCGIRFEAVYVAVVALLLAWTGTGYAGGHEVNLMFSADGGKTYLDEAPAVKVGSRLLVKATWRAVLNESEVLTTELYGAQSDFASANRGRVKVDGREVWAQRLEGYYFDPAMPGACVYVMDFAARPEGRRGFMNLWEAGTRKYVDGPLPVCQELAPGSYMFHVRFQNRLKKDGKLLTSDIPFIVKLVDGDVPGGAGAKSPGRAEEWLPTLSGDYVFPVSTCQGLYGAPKPRLSGQFLVGGSDCGWIVAGVKEGDYYIRLLVEWPRGNSIRPLAYLNGVPISFDHASEIGCFRKTCFAVVESGKPLRVRDGDVLRLDSGACLETWGIATWTPTLFGAAALSTARMAFAPEMVAPITVGWAHDRFTVKAVLTPGGRLSVAVVNRSGAKESYKISCKVLDYFQNKLAEFAAAPSLADAESFKKDLAVKLHATDRCRAVVTVEDGKGFKAETTAETFRDDLESFRKKVWLNSDWRMTVVPDDGTPATRALQGIDGLKADAKWMAVMDLPARWKYQDAPLAWFEKTFTVPLEMAGDRVFIHFTRASNGCRIFLNGRQLADHPVSSAAFDVELTGRYALKSQNRLLVELKAGDSPGLGEVWLFSAPERMIGDVFPQTSFRDKALKVDVEVPEASFVPGSTLLAQVSLEGRTLLVLPSVKLESSGVKTLAANWDAPPLWGPETFPLLRLTTELRGPDGALLDRVDTRFGFREFWAEGMELKWNGVKVKFASRAFMSCWGSMLQGRIRGKIRWLLQMDRRNGCDMLRHIYDPEYYAEIADEEGMPFAQGGANTVGSGFTKQQLDSDEFWERTSAIGVAVAKTLRNHPSIVEWYLSNEYFGFSEKRCGERLTAYGEKVAAVDPTRIREFGCDLDLHGASPVISTHYPVDNRALVSPGAYFPEAFYWRRFGTPFVPGMKVPDGMVKTVCNVFGESPIEWGRKPIIINESCFISHFAPPDGFSRLVGDEAYRSIVAVDAAHRLANKWFSRGHRDAQASAITLWKWITGDPNSYSLPVIDVNILQQWNKFRSGAAVTYDVNLTRDLRDAKTLDFHWELRSVSGDVLDSQTNALAFSSCDLKRERIALKLPEVGVESLFTLVAELKDGQTVCASYTLPLHVYPTTTGGLLGLFGSDASKVQAKVKVGLFDPAGNSVAKLRAVFGEVAKVGTSDLDEIGLLVVGENQKTEDLARAAEQLKAYVRGGGTVLLLRQNALPRILPVELSLSDLAASTNFSYRPGHPLLDGVAADELNYWYPNHKTGSQYYVKPKNGNFKVVVESGGPRGMEYAGLVELPYGKGAFVCTQLDLLDNYAENPVAWKLMRNIAAFATAPKTAMGPVAFVGPAEPALARSGAKLDAITSPEALRGRRAAILNAAGGVEPRFAAALKDFVAEGGELLILNADTGCDTALSDICGKSLLFRDTIPPTWSGRAVVCRRGVLSEGLNNYDLFWKDRPETERIATCFAQESMQALLGSTTIEAEGVVPQLYPSFLLEVERGKGRVLFCNLNLGAKERRVKNHASLLAATLLTNLGVELEPAKELSIPKDLAYFPVDISTALNRSLVDEMAEDGKGGWSDQGPEADLRSFPRDKAVQTFNGVPFRIERPNSCLALSSKCAKGGVDRAELPVGMKADALFFLQSSAWTSDGHHASYFVNYGDGTNAEIRLVGGVNLRDWSAAKPEEAFTGEEGTFTVHAWTGTMAKHGKCSLFLMAWPNPHPEKLVKSITAVSMRQGVPILVAVTAGVRKEWDVKAASGPEALAKAGKLLAEADALFKADKFAAAEQLYQEAAAAAWETRDAYLGLGYARERLGRRAEAIAAYEQLIAINPKLFEPYKCVGRCYEADGNFEKALETYRRSLAMDPNQPDVMAYLAKVKAKLGR